MLISLLLSELYKCFKFCRKNADSLNEKWEAILVRWSRMVEKLVDLKSTFLWHIFTLFALKNRRVKNRHESDFYVCNGAAMR